MFELASTASVLSVFPPVYAWFAYRAIGWFNSLGFKLSFLSVDPLLLHTLSSVCIALLCQASIAALGYLLVLERIYIQLFFLYVLILLHLKMFVNRLIVCFSTTELLL